MISIKQRVIGLTFVLGEGTFPEGNSVELQGLRTSVNILKGGAGSQNQLDMTVYGMTKEVMNKLTTQGQTITNKKKNTVTVTAGDVGGAQSIVFVGIIYDAWADFSQVPDVPFRLTAQTGVIDALNPGSVKSYTDGVDVKDVMQKLANEMGLKFEGNGISKQIPQPYYIGALREQAAKAAQAAGIEWMIDDTTLAIWIPGEAREGDSVKISPETGMIGYPSYTSYGLTIKTLFNPNIKFAGEVTIETSLPETKGPWVVNRLEYNLESNNPGGQWMTTLMVVPIGYGPTVPSATSP